MFQVASQFNLLEMISPNVTPDDGIGIYENDPTQGPACAIACGAGTIYRNYLVRSVTMSVNRPLIRSIAWPMSAQLLGMTTITSGRCVMVTLCRHAKG